MTGDGRCRGRRAGTRAFPTQERPGCRRMTALRRSGEPPPTCQDAGRVGQGGSMGEHDSTSIVWVDGADPAAAVAAAGSKMGRLAELHAAGVEVPRGFAITVD